MTLDEISKALSVRTDKGSANIMDHNYLVRYEEYVAPIADKVSKILELGVDRGGSILLWHKYFNNADIHAVDYELHRNEVVDLSRVTLYEGDYMVSEFMNHIINSVGQDIDIIIDDGNHAIDSQMHAIRSLSKCLSYDGYYFLEDILDVNVGRHIIPSLEETDLELLEDYCDPSYIPHTMGVHHLLVLRRKRK
jgi:cephalosporin hydroxylase